VGLWSGDARAEATAAALAPYGWRNFTDRMFARRVVGAVDRFSVISFIASLPGTDVGVVGPVEPAERRDERVDVLVRVLEDRHWRGLSLERLCAELMAALDEWQNERDAFHRDLRRLLEER
jgi:hypothetical protein